MTSNPVHMPTGPFAFDRSVATIFPNMAERSIPGYRYCHNMVRQLSRDVDIRPGNQVWDLGCSRGDLIMQLRDDIDEPLTSFHAMDRSAAMISVAQETYGALAVRWYPHDVTMGLPDEMEDVAIAVFGWTLQFLAVTDRRRVLTEVQERMTVGGAIFVMEKFSCGPERLQREYLRWRRMNGYEPEEIMRKNAALEGVMIPWSRADLIAALRSAGFKDIHPFHTEFNFGGHVAAK